MNKSGETLPQLQKIATLITESSVALTRVCFYAHPSPLTSQSQKQLLLYDEHTLTTPYRWLLCFRKYANIITFLTVPCLQLLYQRIFPKRYNNVHLSLLHSTTIAASQIQATYKDYQLNERAMCSTKSRVSMLFAMFPVCKFPHPLYISIRRDGRPVTAVQTTLVNISIHVYSLPLPIS